MNIKLKSLLKIITVSLVLVGTPVLSTNVSYAVVDTSSLKTQATCQGDAKTCVCPTDKPVAGCGKDNVTTEPIIDCDGDGKPDVGCNLFNKYLNPFIALLSIVAGIGIVIGIIMGGIQYSASGGDPQKTAIAKKRIKDSVLALLALLFLYALLRFLIPGGNLKI